MAFVQEDDEENQNQPETSGAGGLITGGASGGSAKSPSSPNAPGGMPGNFVGIQQYLDANKPQSDKLANQVGGYVTDLGDTARSTVSNQKNQFQNAVDTNTVGFDENLYNEAQKNPQAVAADAARKASFQKMYNANYQGPQSFTGSDYDTAASKATNAATEAANQTKTEQGQKQLVSGLQKKTAGYSTEGASAFDSLLLQAAPNARQILGDAANKQSDLNANLAAVRAEENKAASDAATKTANTSKTVQGTFGNNALQNQIQKTLMDRAGSRTQTAKDNVNAIIEKLKRGESLTDEELTRSGLGGNASVSPYTSIQNYRNYVPDLGSYFHQEVPDITGQQVATPEEYARYAALNDLTSQKADYLTNPSLAETGNADPLVSFDLGQFMNDAIAKRNLELAEAEKKRLAGIPPDPKKPDALQTRVDDAALGTAILPGIGTAVGFASPEIRKGAKSVSETGKRVGSSISKGVKSWVPSDLNLKKDISKFDPSEFLDSLMRKQHG